MNYFGHNYDVSKISILIKMRAFFNFLLFLEFKKLSNYLFRFIAVDKIIPEKVRFTNNLLKNN